MVKPATAKLPLRLFCLLFSFSFFVLHAFAQTNPDVPDFALLKGNDKQAFMERRAEAINLRRGVEKDKPFNPANRTEAVRQMEMQKAELRSMPNSQRTPGLLAAWTELGPNPIPNGQVSTGSQLPVSGRVTAIAIHPTNPNIVYVGAAQGGVFRSLDGGATWTPILDNAQTLAIGALALAPSSPDILYVGTGEGNFSSDSYFGVGIYRINNASSATPIVTGPLSAASNPFLGRAVSEILVHPTDPATIFVSSTSAAAGINGSAAYPTTLPLNNRGIYRSTNATSGTPTFTQLAFPFANQNLSVRDIILDPLNPNLLVANVISNGGGIIVSTNALSATPTFTQPVTFTSTSTSELTGEFAIQHTVGNPNPTIYCATGNLGGRVLRSIDGGTTWTQQIDNNFCTPQCFYDIAIAVDPVDATRVYLGGAPALIFGISTNSGVSFTGNATTAQGLHVDTHVIEVSPSNPNIIYFGSDGGIYKSTNSGSTWTSLNNSTFRATQFMGLSVHPTNANFTIGGTQDNGTNMLRPDGTWFRIDFGDGGYSVIDQNATNTTSVDMYHTYFNASNLAGYGYLGNGTSATEGTWTFRGCNGVSGNGIVCPSTGIVNFYAPLEQGPGNPNTIYYGADRLYRSADKGANHTTVSQTFTSPLSAIGISPQNDNVRIIGLNDGRIFGTTTGLAVLTDLDPGNNVPANFIGRAVIDPNNVNTAYVTLCAFNVANVWKTTNLNSATPTWTSVSSGIPQVPVNAFLVDPSNSNNLYAGTDIGVYASTDGGATWSPFGTGLPAIAVFDMAIQPTSQVLRIATHGRGLWQISLVPVVVPALSINDVTMNEGNAGTTTFTFTVSLSSPAPSGGVTFDIATADNTATTANNDYVAKSLAGQTIPAGSSTYMFDVTVNGDVAVEPNESFFVNVTNVTNATVADGQGVGTITNDDAAPLPTLSINDVTMNEGNAGTTTFTFTVSLSSPAPTGGVTFDIATADNTATTANNDYVAKSLTGQAIPAGSSTYMFDVTVNGDVNVEPNESFFVNVTNVTNATVGDGQGVGTITNDDAAPLPTLSINDVTQNEGNAGTTTFTFTVSLSSPAPTGGVTFDIATADNTATTANNDYVAKSLTGQTIPAGSSTYMFDVTVNGDVNVEPNESFFVNVTNVTNATVGDGQGEGTIVNDDVLVYTIDVALTGAQEVPANPSTGIGAFTGTYDPATNQLSFVLKFTGLLSPTTAAHIHGPATAGVNAPVIIGFTGFPTGVTTGTYSNTYVLTEAQEAQLLCGLWYINIHTTGSPGGEIRGQIKEAPASSFDITVAGSQEVPANPSTGLGTLTGTYDAATNILSFELKFTGLVSPTTAAHFHAPAQPGVNAPVVIGFTGFPVGVTTGSYANTYVLTDAQETQLLGGLWYVNIHTSASPGGEIRGQLQEGTLPMICPPSFITYYPRTTATDLSMTSNWTDAPSGTGGSSPANFSSPNQLFNLNTNVANPVVNGSWGISGGSNLVLNNTAPVVFTPSANFSLGSGSSADFNGKPVTLRSTAAGTAFMGVISGMLTNASNVTVERYITSGPGGTHPDGNRAYRLLAPSVNTLSNIRANWQEGVNNPNAATNLNPVLGYGTHITGSTTGANGFDATQTGQGSLFIYDAVTPSWQYISNTNVNTLDAKSGYLLYIRGDRSIDMNSTANPLPSTNTTLRATGTLLTGTQSFTGLTGNSGFSLVTNPYAAPINWASVHAASTGAASSYTLWDPNIGSLGGYVTVNTAGMKSNASSNATISIQSGQAFFVQASGVPAPVINVMETHKSPMNNIDVFRLGTQTELFTSSLFFTNGNGTRINADGVTSVYNNAYSAAVDGDDATQIANWDEDIAISRNGNSLSIETRPLIDVYDTIPFTVARLQVRNYEWQFNATGFNHPNLSASLRDNFTGAILPVNLNGMTVIPFTVTSNPASSAANRFRVIFGPNTALPVNMSSVKAYQKGKDIQVEWTAQTEVNLEKYEVEESADARQFSKAATLQAKGTNNANYDWLDVAVNNGSNYYRIKAISKTGEVQYSKIVRVNIGKTTNEITVYPNPVNGNVFTLSVNLPKGTYTVTLTNKLGQQVYKKQIVHFGDAATQTIQLGKQLAQGIYQVTVSDGENNYVQQLVKE